MDTKTGRPSDLELRGDTRLRALRLAPRLTGNTRFSHITAAELHGLRLPEQPVSAFLHVTGRDAVRGVRRFGVVGHRSVRPIMPVRVDGLPCSDPVTAWCECAELLTIDDLTVMGDGLVGRAHPVATLEQLETAVAGRQGARGARRLARALGQIRPRTDSARETMLRLLVLRLGFPEPVINDTLISDNGQFLGYGDLVWPRHRIVLEYEGRQHAEDRDQFARDLRRIDSILEARYRHIRVDAALIRDSRRLAQILGVAFLAAGGSLPRGGTFAPPR